MCKEPHKWCKEIKAWADGVEIEYRNKLDFNTADWNTVKVPSWATYEGCEYRIKPEPKPDLVRYIGTSHDTTGMHTDNLNSLYFWPNKIKLTYDGENPNILKSVEIIK